MRLRDIQIFSNRFISIHALKQSATIYETDDALWDQEGGFLYLGIHYGFSLVVVQRQLMRLLQEYAVRQYKVGCK